MTTSLTTLLSQALAARTALLTQLHAEQTDCYRLFHGSVEGRPGLTVDRYGDLLLVQAFHEPLEAAELAALGEFYRQGFPDLQVVYNDRSQANSRVSNVHEGSALEAAEQSRVVSELGVKFHIQARHKGQDPWLFLDLRAARRRVQQLAAGKRVLNVFAYTCGVGVVAAKAGAEFVMNVDFAESSLAVGRDNARINDLPHRPRFVLSDAFAAMRQLSGAGQAKFVRGKAMPKFPPLQPQQFDLVFLDPPRYAKSPFGVVDVVNDYPALFKLALLCTRAGGTLICCNNAAEVDGEAWLQQLQRSAAKAGRPVLEASWIAPEADFPNLVGQPPLKMVELRV